MPASSSSPQGLTVDELVAAVDRASAGRIPVTVLGASDKRIRSVAPLDGAAEDQLSFLSNPRYRNIAATSRAGAVVLTEADSSAVFTDQASSQTRIVCAHPYAWFAYAAQQLCPEPRPQPGRSPQASVHAQAQVAEGVCIEPFAVVEAGAKLEQGAWIGAGAYVGRNVHIGANARLFPGVRILDGCSLGQRSVLHSGVVIGADGFGFAPFQGQYIKIPQTGAVRLGNDVDIGANTTIDRGTMDDTVIEDGVKIDNQVQIGHNCRIGAHTVIAGCVGIAGSATIGAGCQVGGAAMIAGHLTIAAGTIVGPGTLVSRSIAQPGYYTGFFPLMSNRDWEKNAAVVRHLSELRDRVRALEKQLKTSDST